MSTDAHRASEPKAPETHHVESKDGASDYDNTPQFLETEGDRAKVVHADGTIDYVDTHALGGDAHEMPTGYYKSPQFIGTVVAQCLASICAYLGWVLPANTLTLINADLGPSANISWASTIWTMGSAIGFLLVGRLSDLYGRKWMVQSTTILSLVGCILGATSKNVTMLIVANGCNGIGAAGQLSFGIVLGELVPNKMRGPIVAIVFLSSLPFAVFGPIIARTFIESTAAGWRWSYYLGIILNGITVILYHFLYHPPSFEQLHVGKTRLQQTKELDWIGIVLYVSGCVLFLIGLSWGGVAYAWQSAEVLCTLLIGIVTIAVFFIYEAYFCHVQPLMPPRMLRNVHFDAIIVIAVIGAMIYYSMTVLWPTIISSLYTTDSIEIGWQSSVVGGAILMGQTIAGFAISYVPHTKYQCIIAAVISMVFFTAMSTMSADGWSRTIGFSIVGIGAIGYLDNIVFPGVTLLWGPQDIGLATGMLGSLRGLGGAIAQALYVSIFTNKMAENTPKYVVPAATEAGLPEDSLPALFAGITAGNFTGVPGINDEIIVAVGGAMKTASAKSLQIVFYTTIPFSVILLIAAILSPDFKKYLTQDVAKRLQDNQFRKENQEKAPADV